MILLLWVAFQRKCREVAAWSYSGFGDVPPKHGFFHQDPVGSGSLPQFLPNFTRKTLRATVPKPRSLITEIQILRKYCRNISIMFRQQLCRCSKIWVRTFLVRQTSVLHDTFNGYKLHFHSSDATWEEHQGPSVVWSNAAYGEILGTNILQFLHPNRKVHSKITITRLWALNTKAISRNVALLS